MVMPRDSSDDTLRFMLDQSRRNLINATAIFERGRIETNEQSVIKPMGTWSVTQLFHTKRLSLMWFIRQAPRSNVECPPLRFTERAVYIGLTGKVQISVGNEYRTISPGREFSVDSYTEHTLEPLDRQAEVVQVLVKVEE